MIDKDNLNFSNLKTLFETSRENISGEFSYFSYEEVDNQNNIRKLEIKKMNYNCISSLEASDQNREIFARIILINKNKFILEKEFEETLKEIDLLGKYETFLKRNNKNILNLFMGGHKRDRLAEQNGTQRLKNAEDHVHSATLLSPCIAAFVSIVLIFLAAFMASYLIPFAVLTFFLSVLLAWFLGGIVSYFYAKEKGRFYYLEEAGDAVMAAISQDRKCVIEAYPVNHVQEETTNTTPALAPLFEPTNDQEIEILDEQPSALKQRRQQNQVQEMQALRARILACDHHSDVSIFFYCSCRADDAAEDFGYSHLGGGYGWSAAGAVAHGADYRRRPSYRR
ncbi:MAG: hypothetical protein A3F13_01005 [Gammaproteobacteria bacterium RIFCSPHIGHO2_12_FULL_40_19]|nr:MAG: hypothetical protein A3F13_01005 [Gammaproteobacteria bacterium RIFCSPHIGHO2_12_FULL_40_19]